MRSSSVLVILVCILWAMVAPASAQRQVVAISSFEQNPTEPYYMFGDVYEFQNLVSDGSTQNLERVRLQDDVFFAICQEDVASYYYTGGNEIYAKGHSEDMRVTAIARLFSEDAYLVVRPGIDRLKQIFPRI